VPGGETIGKDVSVREMADRESSGGERMDRESTDMEEHGQGDFIRGTNMQPERYIGMPKLLKQARASFIRKVTAGLWNTTGRYPRTLRHTY